MGSTAPGGYSTVIIKTSLPGISVRSFDMSDVTLACCAITVPVMRNIRTNNNVLFIIVSFGLIAARSGWQWFSIDLTQQPSDLGIAVARRECQGTLICLRQSSV